jgi:hypothetical protein
MRRLIVVPLGLIATAVPSAAGARETGTLDASERAPAAERARSRAPKRDQPESRRTERDAEQRSYLLSVEAVAHVPLDVGAQLGFETPFGLRGFAGYGFMPSGSIGALASLGGGANGPLARAFLDRADYGGHILRFKLGVRPFSGLGVYLDAGYARAELRARLEGTAEVTGLGSVSGGYHAASSLDLWLVELGYQVEMIADRLVLAAALGMTGTLDAQTTITPVGSAPDSPRLAEAASEVDRGFRRYGYVPTITLRAGFNLL